MDSVGRLVYTSAHLLLLLLLTPSLVTCESGDETRGVQFRFTIRSFQEQLCMTREYFDLYCKGVDFSSVIRRQRHHCLEEQVRAGHPDFNPFWACRDEVPTRSSQIVQPQLHYDDSGIGKPVYCNNYTATSIAATDEGYLCGVQVKNGRGRRSYPDTSGKERFDEWYNDVRGVNKRVGVPIRFIESKETSLFEQIRSERGMPPRNVSAVVSRYDSNDPRFYKTTAGFFPLDDFTLANGGASVDPLEFQSVWPIASPAVDRKYSFTTELHSVFTYFGGETFMFKGDDDVYVFINGFLELDLGGRHTELTGYIFLDDLTHSTLVVNETYSIDLFHAERMQRFSNFAITSTLVAPLAINDIGVTGFDWITGNGADFVYIGSLPSQVHSTNDTLKLLDVIGTSRKSGVGYLLLQRRLLVNKGFIVEVGVSITGSGTSGFTLILHNGDAANLPLTGRESRESEFEGVGVAQGEKSLGLTLNLCANENKPVWNTTTCVQEVRLHAQGQTTTFLARSSILGRLNDGRVHSIVLSYTAATRYLEVFIDDSLYLLQTKFEAMEYLGTDPTSVGISIFQDSIISAENEGFRDVRVELHSFKVIVAEFWDNAMFTAVDIVMISSVALALLFLLYAKLHSSLRAIWRTIHSCVAFVEDATAIFLLVEKACELCPGTPATDVFLIFFGVEFVFQIVPHVTRHSPMLCFLAYVGIEAVQLFLFLNLLRDTVNTESAGIFVVCAGIQVTLVSFGTIHSIWSSHREERLAKKTIKKEWVEDKICGVVDKVLLCRISNDCISTISLGALPLLTIFIYPRTSAFQEKWYQILVAQNLWYRSVVIDSMVENLSDEEYSKADFIWTSAGRAQLHKEWVEWSRKESTLAILSVGHTLLLHVFSAGLALMHLEGDPPASEVGSCYVTLLAVPYSFVYAYNVWRSIRDQEMIISTKDILEKPAAT